MVKLNPIFQPRFIFDAVPKGGVQVYRTPSANLDWPKVLKPWHSKYEKLATNPPCRTVSGQLCWEGSTFSNFQASASNDSDPIRIVDIFRATLLTPLREKEVVKLTQRPLEYVMKNWKSRSGGLPQIANIVCWFPDVVCDDNQDDDDENDEDYDESDNEDDVSSENDSD